MNDLTEGFIAPSRNGPLALRGMVPSDDEQVLAKAAEKLSPAVVQPVVKRGWSGTIIQTWRNGRLIGIKATETKAS